MPEYKKHSAVMLFSVVVGMLLALAAPGALKYSHGPVPWEQTPVRVISNASQIDFPNGVLLTLEAQSGAPITEVILRYRLGRQKTTIYAYPSFTPSTRVTTDYKIKTGGSYYLPSGTDIEYYYELRDVGGHTFTTSRYTLEYKDPAFNWQRLQKGDLTILWHDRPGDAVADVAAEVDQRLEAAKKLLGEKNKLNMKAVIINGGDEVARSFPLVSDAARRGHLYGGFAFGELDVFILAGVSADGIALEMTHLLIDEALDSPRAILPAWLNEGLAMYFEYDPGSGEGVVLNALRQGRLFPLSSMATVPGKPQAVGLFYAQARSVVQFMMDTYGQGPMTSLFSTMNGGKRFEDALLQAYGLDLDEIEREWKRSVT